MSGGAGRRWVALVLLLLTAGAAFGQTGGVPDDGSLGTRGSLDELVLAYFRSEVSAADERRSLVKAIEEAAQGSVESVAQSVAKVQLWSVPEISGNALSFSFELAAGKTVEVVCELPPEYDPTLRHPVLLAFSNKGATPADTLDTARSMLGGAIDRFVLIAPQVPVGGVFHQPAGRGADLRRLLVEIRRRFHIDTDRTFLFGVGSGGDAVWIAAMMHPELFAGAVILAGYAQLPYPEQMYPLLLENLASLPVLSVWSAVDDPGASRRARAVSVHSRLIGALASRDSLPIKCIELLHPVSPIPRPPSDESRLLLAKMRERSAPEVAHWFRYHPQGGAGWIRQSRFKGEAWESDQLSILPSLVTDRDEFVTGVLQDKLGYLGATVKGQTIEIETRKCSGVELLFWPGLIDLGEPVMVRCNGKRRHNGTVKPSISTLLEAAYTNWEFQRLIYGRLALSIKSDLDG